ncbi:MAG: PAS domain S-box protein [Planctomycetes bacterium]|nr:PAS domain S-box protein [Planctomycetota bacterium]
MPIHDHGHEASGDGAGADDLLLHVFEAAPSAMLLVAADGRIRTANRHLEQLFGHRREDLAGQPVEMLVPERFRGPHPEHRAGFLRAPSVRAMGAGRDLFGLRRDGSEVPIEIGLNPMRVRGELYVLASIIDITQRKRGENLLRASLAEKETLLREIHHRVKNNMQVVSSLLSLQTSNVDEPRYRAMFEECQARVRAMALIHEKLYASGNLSQLDAGEYVRELAHMLVRSYDQRRARVRLDVVAEALPLDIQTAIPVGLLLNELVTNAMKHAFEDGQGGTVRVALRCVGGSDAELCVADDGRGMAEPTAPAEAGPTRGLGLRLVRGLVRQIDGELHRRTESGRGVAVTIRFPLPAPAPAEPATSPENEP